jgi:hypothetical protein
MSQGCDVFVSECDDAMTNGSRLTLRVSVLEVLEGLP